MPFFVGPRVLNRPHSIIADVEIPAGGAEGVLICQGTAVSGWALYVQDERLHYVHNYVRRDLDHVASPEPLLRVGTICASSSSRPVRLTSRPAAAPRASPAPRRRRAGQADRHAHHDADALQPGSAALRCQPRFRHHPRLPVAFAFTGTLHTVTIDLSGDLIVDTDSEMRLAMARQ